MCVSFEGGRRSDEEEGEGGGGRYNVRGGVTVETRLHRLGPAAWKEEADTVSVAALR